MAKRNVVDFKIINLSEEKFQELKEAGQIDPNALYTTPDTTKERLDALEATAVNYDNITNCITHIPQDIKLELNNGTLTLKAGSKVYVPNGAGVFDEVVNTADTSVSIAEAARQLIFYNVNTRGMWFTNINAQRSGTTNPSDLYGFFYNTNDNKIYYLRNTTTPDNHTFSFPIALVTSDGTKITSIDQVFNGFGYIGSTIFTLPGIKWLAPNGRNADGTLRNNAYTSTKVQAFTYSNRDQPNIIFCMGTDSFYTSGQVISSETEPSKAYTFWYKPSENVLRAKAEGAYVLAQSTIPVGSFDMTTTGVSNVYTKTAFQAVDYNDLYPSTAGSLMSRILGGIYPAGSLYLTTYNTAACPIADLIPGSTWELIGSGRALWTGNGSNGGSTIAAGLPNITGSIEITGETGVWFQTGDGSGALSTRGSAQNIAAADSVGRTVREHGIAIDASRSSSVYGNSTTVQPPAFVVNVWRRTA